MIIFDRISRYTNDPFWDAALEVISDKPRGSSIDLSDLLARYTRMEHLDDCNLLHCTCCLKKTKSTKQLKFKELPAVFCIQLKVIYYATELISVLSLQ